jgi:hypothetical protein
MMRYLLQVSSRALSGREADYERWYSEVHVRDVLALPGFLACTRHKRMTPGANGALADVDLVAIYEVETNDPGGLLQSLFAAAPQMKMTDAIDLSSVRFEFLQPLGGRYVK